MNVMLPHFWAQLNFKDTTLASADRTPCRGCRSPTQVKASGSVGGAINGDTPKWMVSSLKSTKMDDLGVPAFYEPPSRIKFDQQKLQCGPKWIGNSRYSRHKMGCLVAIFVFAHRFAIVSRLRRQTGSSRSHLEAKIRFPSWRMT
jgi:hypothetical protein